MQQMPKVMPSGNEEEPGNEYLEGLNQKEDKIEALGDVLDGIEKMTAAQAAELIPAIRRIPLSKSQPGFETLKDMVGDVLNALQEKINAESAAEDMLEKSPEAQLSSVPAGVDPEKYAQAQDRLAHIVTVFNELRGYLDKNTLKKVEAWQGELDGLAEVLGKEATDPLYSQLEAYSVDVAAAQNARDRINSQPSARAVAPGRPRGRVPAPSASQSAAQEPKKPWYKFW